MQIEEESWGKVMVMWGFTLTAFVLIFALMVMFV